MTEQSNQSRIIDVKQAVLIAWDYIQLFDDKIPLQNLRLEETELTDNEKFWLITLGYSCMKQYKNNPFNIAPSIEEAREYKIIKINAETGKVESMKIRQL